MKTKRIILSLVYTLIFLLVGWAIFAVIANNINSFFYKYELTTYQHELDTFFQPQALNSLRVKYTYRSGERGAIYYATADTLSNIAVIEATNYHGVSLNNILPEGAEKVDLSQNKTYTTIVNDPFPLVQQALNPRESAYLNIVLKKPYQVEREVRHGNYCYIKGSFKVAVFGNTQNCSIVTFRGAHDNEILILRRYGKMYFVVQTATKKSLLEMVNPALMKED